jgi:hypothetical protein
MDAFCSLPLVLWRLQSELDVNAFDDEHTIFSFFDFSPNFSRELAISLDFARLQRAPEGSKQSTCDRSNQIIYGRGMGLSKIFGFHSVVLCNCSVDAEDHWFGFARKLRLANRSLDSFNVRLRHVGNFSHSSSPFCEYKTTLSENPQLAPAAIVCSFTCCRYLQQNQITVPINPHQAMNLVAEPICTARGRIPS